MKLFPAQFPITRALIFYSCGIAAILTVVIAINIYFLVGRAIEKSQNQMTRQDIQTISHTFEVFTRYHTAALTDIAQLPLLARGIMQPESMRTDKTNFMSGLTLLGKKVQLVLLDRRGRTVHATQAYPLFDYSREAWIKKVTEGELLHYLDISSGENENYLRIGVPVFYNNQPEGVLVAEIELNSLGDFSYIFKDMNYYKIDLLHNGTIVQTFGPALTGPVHEISLLNPDLTIQYSWDHNILNQTRYRLIAQISLGLLAVAFIFLLGSLYISNRLYVNPLKQLRKLVLKVYHDRVTSELPTNQRLLEISALAEEYNWLINQIRSREKALLDSKENLEARIEERTSELRDSREELRILNESLEEMVTDRTVELEAAQDRLVIQEKMASVGQLAAGLSHELNNPINFVRTNFATLVEDFEDLLTIYDKYALLTAKAAENPLLAEVAADVQVMHKKLRIDYLIEDIPQLFDESERGFVRIAKIIQSMRDFSRIDSGGEFSWANINAGIEDTLIIARNEYKYHAEVETEFGQVADIQCSLEQLNQVFLNLIVNSAHAIASQGREDKGVISIRTWQEGKTVLCEISDDGPGVPVESRRRIFEPFYTTKGPGKGTGLGLSISYDIIVHKHHGELTLHCPDEGGSIFTIALPVNQTEEVTHDSR